MDAEGAVQVMLAANLRPLGPYPTRHEPWDCACLLCGEITSPTYGAIVYGGGCRWCAVPGFKANEPAIVYLIQHAGYGAAKIGIAKASGTRLNKHSREGWQTLATVNALGKVAAAIEDSILKWWRADLQLPPYLGPDEMPQKGWTETVALAEINVAETIRRMRSIEVGARAAPKCSSRSAPDRPSATANDIIHRAKRPSATVLPLATDQKAGLPNLAAVDRAAPPIQHQCRTLPLDTIRYMPGPTLRASAKLLASPRVVPLPPVCCAMSIGRPEPILYISVTFNLHKL